MIDTGSREKPLGEKEHIASPVPQRRKIERDHRKPVVEVFPEAPLSDGRLEVGVRGADEAGVD
jgi:hypothetical protein